MPCFLFRRAVHQVGWPPGFACIFSHMYSIVLKSPSVCAYLNFKNIYIVWAFFLSACLFCLGIIICTMCMPWCLGRQKEGIRSPATGIMNGCEFQTRVLLSVEPFLQPSQPPKHVL